MLGTLRPRPSPGQALRAPAPALRPGPPGLAVAPGLRAAATPVSQARALGSAEQLREVRRGHEAESARLGTVRREATGLQQGQEEERTRALLRHALQQEVGPPERPVRPPAVAPEAGSCPQGPPPPVGPGGATATPPMAEAPRGVDAEALLALVERIETFVRAQRPALALTLQGALAARVELERTGPGEVAVTLVGRSAGVRHADVERLRAAVQARGLRLRRLVVAGPGEPTTPD